MNCTAQIAKHFREVYFGGNWCCSNLKDNLATVTWQQATTPVYSCNTIAVLVYHIHYYIIAVSKVLQGEALDASDKYSFDHPPILCAADWKNLLNRCWAEAESFASLVEHLQDSILQETFCNEKYGTYYRNLQGVIEHVHYHLGQIVLIKKILLQANQN